MSKDTQQNKAPTIRVVMLPRDTNGFGKIFGGVLLSQIDLAASEHARSVKAHRYVTKVMREVEFIAPVEVGDVVSFYTTTKKQGTTSITVKVLVTAERGIGTRSAIKVTEAEVVMVAIDANGQAIPI